MISSVIAYLSAHATPILALLLGLEQFLASFDKIKANSIFQLFSNAVSYLKSKFGK